MSSGTSIFGAVCWVFVFLILLSSSAMGISVVGGKGDIVVPVGQKIQDDLAATGQSVSVAGTIDGDLFAAASNVGFSGKTTGGAWLAGGSVTSSGLVGSSLRACGSTVNVSSMVAKDLLAVATNFTLAPGAKVGRDLAIAGTNLSIGSPVGRNLYAAGTNVILGSRIGGSAVVKAQRLILLPGAIIRGDLAFQGKSLEIQPGAKIVGKIVRKAPVPGQEMPRRIGALRPLWFLLLSLALIIFGAVLTGILPRFVSGVASRVRDSFGASLGWGILVAAVGGVAVMVALGLTFTFVLAPLTLSFLSIYSIAVYASVIFVGAALGKTILRWFGKAGDSTILNMLIGTIVICVVCSVPLVGWIIWFLAAAVGLGALLLWLRNLNIPSSARAQVPLVDVPPSPSEGM